jgi:hypothetical protein
MLEVTQGDQATITINLLRDISAYTSAQVTFWRQGRTVTKTVSGPFTGTSFNATVEPADLDTVGQYWLSAVMLPGPHTYPNSPLILTVLPKSVTV